MKKCILYFQGEAYDPDTIISIDMVSKATIKINMKNERRHYFSYGKDGHEKARNSYNELMALYDEAVETRKKDREKEKENESKNNNCNGNNSESPNKAYLTDQNSRDENSNKKHDKEDEAKPESKKDTFTQETLF